MPLVKVEMLEGKSKEFRKTVLDCIHDGLMDSIGIEDWDRFQRIVEYEKENFEIPSFKSDDNISRKNERTEGKSHRNDHG